MVLNKISLIASTLGLTVVGAGVDVNSQHPLHDTYTDLSSAYTFETVEECKDKIQHLYEVKPELKGKLNCTQS